MQQSQVGIKTVQGGHQETQGTRINRYVPISHAPNDVKRGSEGLRTNNP